MYTLMAYKEDLSAQLQNALVCKANGHFSELQQAIEARSSQALRTASNRFQTKRSIKKNRVQNSALTPSWRSN
jgi:hypothetical protein